MRAITVWQPYASLVSVRAKSIETRSWGTTYRGPLLVHASKKWDPALRLALRDAQRDLRRLGLSLLDVDDLPFGAVVAVAILADSRPMDRAPDARNEAFGHFGLDRYGWVLEDIRALPRPIPWAGSQGLWHVPGELEERVRMALNPKLTHVGAPTP